MALQSQILAHRHQQDQMQERDKLVHQQDRKQIEINQK